MMRTCCWQVLPCATIASGSSNENDLPHLRHLRADSAILLMTHSSCKVVAPAMPMDHTLSQTSYEQARHFSRGSLSSLLHS
jgi:hypothetical protein